jgi:hypothetical protein
MAKIPFPSAMVGETSPFRPSTPVGLYAYRQMQSLVLLDPPDYADGNLSREQRREALRASVVLSPPLTALCVFQSVVALEDLIREMGSGLARLKWVQQKFPQVSDLAPKPKRPKGSASPHGRPDTDPFPLTDFKKVNNCYKKILDVRPLPDAEFPRLDDLAIVRHTVAHHGSIFRDVDAQRFQYYEVIPNSLINPPPDFVRDTTAYLYKIGSDFERAVRRRLFSIMIPTLSASWLTAPPPELEELIVFFNYLGLLPSSEDVPSVHRAVPMDPAADKQQAEAVRKLLLQRALAKVETESKP